MPIVSDFSVIIGNNEVIRLGDPSDYNDALTVWTSRFDTGGRHSRGRAFLMFNVKGLTTTSDDVPVTINHQVVGHIHPYKGIPEDNWHNQIITFPGNILRNGNNDIRIEAITYSVTPPEGNIYDDFWLKDMVCFFQQGA
jgi:hypothetical protein